MMNYSNYLYIAIRAAIDAGKAIMDIYTDPASDFEIERKADNECPFRNPISDIERGREGYSAC